MPEPTSNQQGDAAGALHYVLAGMGGLATALVALWHRLTTRENDLKAAHTLAIEAIQESAESHETLLRETLTTLQGMHADQERTHIELRELRDRQALIEQAVADVAGSVSRLTVEVKPIMEGMRDQTSAMRELASAIRVLIDRQPRA